MLDKLRSLASDTIIYGLSTIVQRFLTFLLTPFYTNFLSKEEFGLIAYIYACIAFLNVLYSFGFESAFFRYYRASETAKQSLEDSDSQHKTSVYSHSYIAILVTSALSTLCMLVFSRNIAQWLFADSSMPEASLSFIQMAIAIPFLDALMIIPFARLRMERRSRLFALLKLAMVIINIIANIILVGMFDGGGNGVIIAGVISSLTGVVFFAPSILLHIRKFFTQKGWNGSLFSDLVAFGLPTLPASFSAMILQVADRPLLLAFTSKSVVGEYNANYRLGIPMMLAVSVFEFAWKPFYLTHLNDPDAKQLFSRVFTYFTLLGATTFLCIAFFITEIVKIPFPGGHLIKSTYWAGLGIVPIIAAAYLFHGMSTNFSAGLHITKATKYLPLPMMSAAITNVILNLLLIPSLGYWGAAWATLAAYIVGAIVMYVFSQKVYPLDYEWNRIGIILGATTAVYATVTLLLNNPAIEVGHVWIRCLGIVTFITLISISGFFSASERAFLHSFFRRS